MRCQSCCACKATIRYVPFSTKFVAQIVARKSKFRLIPVEANSTAKDSNNSAGLTNRKDGALMITNMTDGSHWVFPGLRHIMVVAARG